MAIAMELRRHRIEGTWATLLLPINADESIDFQRLEAEFDVLLASGVDGVYSNGTAGEFYAQTESEYEAISTLLAARCQAVGMPFQIGASYPAPQQQLERVRFAARLRPMAIQVILPDWNPPSLADCIQFLKLAAEAAGEAPLVLYNPPHAKKVLTPEEYGEVAASVPQLEGVKLMHGDAEWYARMLRCAGRLSLFVPGHQLATGTTRGAHGSYSNVACIHPAGAKRWYSRMFTDPAGALEFERRIQCFMNDWVLPFAGRGYSNPALDKLLAFTGDWAPVGTRLRQPYQWITEEEAEPLRAVARRELPELFTQ